MITSAKGDAHSIAFDELVMVEEAAQLGGPMRAREAPEVGVRPAGLGGAAVGPSFWTYSLACLAFELLTGRLPFDNNAVDGGPPLPILFFAPQVSKRL